MIALNEIDDVGLTGKMPEQDTLQNVKAAASRVLVNRENRETV